MLRVLAAFALLLGLHGAGLADTWSLPEVQTTQSANAAYRFTVTPRNVEDRLAYFEAKAAGRDLPTAPPPKGRLERFNGTGWEPVWSADLINEVAPVTVVVSDDGKWVVTLDNWHSMGFGPNVVVIYGEGGRLVRSLPLDALMPTYFQDGLPRSVSSLHWRVGPPRFRDGMLEIPIADPDNDNETPAFSVSIALADGAVQPLQAEVLGSVKPRFCLAHARSVASDNSRLAEARADLVAPVGESQDAWMAYTGQAAERLQPPGRDDGFGSMPTVFELLLPGEYMAKDFKKAFRDALTAGAGELPLRWLTSRDIGLMTAEVERTAKGIKPGQLTGVELRFFADKAHWPRLQSALAKSGATLVLIDIETPIPQRPEVLAQLPADRTVDLACKP